MGHAILYCATCQIQLKDSDFERGAGFRIDALAYCKTCARAAVKQLPPEKVTAILDAIAREAMAEEPPAAASGRTGKPTERRTAKPVENPASPSRLGLVLGALAAVAAILVLLLVGTSRSPDPRPSQDVVVAPPSRPPEPASTLSLAETREPEHAEALRKARDFARTNPADLRQQVAQFEAAVAKAKSTPLEVEAVRELEGARARLREMKTKDLVRVTEQVRAASAAENFAGARRMLDDARKLHGDADAQAQLDRCAEEIARDARKRLEALKAEAADARRKGAESTVQALLVRVTAWELPPLLDEFQKSLPSATPTPPAPISAGVRALAQARTDAAALAAGGEYAAASEAMRRAAGSIAEEPCRTDATADAEMFRLADAAFRGALETLTRWPKGQKIDIEHVGEDGRPRRSSGTLVKADGHRLWIKETDGTAMLYLGELPARSLADLHLRRSGKTPEDERAAAALCFVEGDVEAGRRIWGDRDARGLARLESFPRPTPDPRESEARALFHRAEHLQGAPATAVEAARLCEKILQQYAGTGFVRRLRTPIAERVQSGQEYFLTAADLAAAGTFKVASSEKIPSFWSSSADSDPAARKNCYVEASFSVRGDVEYRCWIYAGGCCAETMAFGVQATDLTGQDPKTRDLIRAEPGGDGWLPVKQSVATANRTHAGHGGRKQPSRWGWVQLPLPKSATDKVCRVRILTDQEGFSAAYVFVSSVKTAPPPDSDLKKLADAAGVRPAPARKGLRVLCYKWKGSVEVTRDAEALQLAARRDPRIKVDVVEDTLADVRLAEYDVVWLSYRTIKFAGKPVNQEISRRAEELKRFVEAGGILWCSAQDDDSFNSTWLPYPVAATSGANETVALTAGQGLELFASPHKIDPPSLIMYDDSWKDWDSHYQVLGAREKAPHHGVFLLARHGRGLYFLAAVASKDPARDEIHSKLFENGLTLLAKLAGRGK